MSSVFPAAPGDDMMIASEKTQASKANDKNRILCLLNLMKRPAMFRWSLVGSSMRSRLPNPRDGATDDHEHRADAPAAENGGLEQLDVRDRQEKYQKVKRAAKTDKKQADQQDV